MDVRSGVDATLVQRERALERQLNTLAASRVQLQSRTQTPETVASLERDITRLEQERERMEVEIRSTSPRYASLAHPEPLTTRGIQRDLLDNDTLLLEFLLGEDRSYVWALSRGSLVSHELPKRAEIEGAVRTVLDLLATQRTSGPGPKTSQSSRSSTGGDQLADATRRLSQMVLGPVANELRGKRLAIVPDGALQYLPFAMLPSPLRSPGTMGSPRDSRSLTPLIVNHEIVTLPSASTLGVIRRELARRTPARDGIAVIADPVFSAGDERLKRDRRLSARRVACHSRSREHPTARAPGRGDWGDGRTDSHSAAAIYQAGSRAHSRRQSGPCESQSAGFQRQQNHGDQRPARHLQVRAFRDPRVLRHRASGILVTRALDGR